MAELLKLAEKSKNEPVKLAAIKDALDRAGLGTRQMIDIEVKAQWEETFGDLVVDEENMFVYAEQEPELPAGLDTEDDVVAGELVEPDEWSPPRSTRRRR
jgi:hypothetical protein